MINKPITLYSANLITAASQVQTSTNRAQITFTQALEVDAFLIKNSAITSVQVDYKASSSQENWTEGPLLTQSQKEDKFFILPNTITAQILRLTCDITIDFEEISAVKKLLTLDKVLSSYTLDNTVKGSSYYVANGSLVCWQEYTKKRLNLNLANISQTLLEQLKSTLKANQFLTYVLFGDFDGYFAVQFALKESPACHLDRKSSLYSLTLTLLER